MVRGTPQAPTPTYCARSTRAPAPQFPTMRPRRSPGRSRARLSGSSLKVVRRVNRATDLGPGCAASRTSSMPRAAKTVAGTPGWRQRRMRSSLNWSPTAGCRSSFLRAPATERNSRSATGRQDPEKPSGRRWARLRPGDSLPMPCLSQRQTTEGNVTDAEDHGEHGHFVTKAAASPGCLTTTARGPLPFHCLRASLQKERRHG